MLGLDIVFRLTDRQILPSRAAVEVGLLLLLLAGRLMLQPVLLLVVSHWLRGRRVRLRRRHSLQFLTF